MYTWQLSIISLKQKIIKQKHQIAPDMENMPISQWLRSVPTVPDTLHNKWWSEGTPAEPGGSQEPDRKPQTLGRDPTWTYWWPEVDSTSCWNFCGLITVVKHEIFGLQVNLVNLDICFYLPWWLVSHCVHAQDFTKQEFHNASFDTHRCHKIWSKKYIILILFSELNFNCCSCQWLLHFQISKLA